MNLAVGDDSHAGAQARTARRRASRADANARLKGAGAQSRLNNARCPARREVHVTGRSARFPPRHPRILRALRWDGSDDRSRDPTRLTALPRETLQVVSST